MNFDPPDAAAWWVPPSAALRTDPKPDRSERVPRWLKVLRKVLHATR